MRTRVLLVIILCLTSMLLLSTGSLAINPLNALFGFDPEHLMRDRFVLLELRLPSLLGGLLAGAALGLSGCVFQRQVHNALASPDVLGVTSGAGAAVLLAASAGSTVPAQMAALLGALSAAALVFLLGWAGPEQLARFVITGMALGYLGSGITSYLLARSDTNELSAAYSWLVGSTRLATTTSLRWLAIALLVGIAVLAVATRPMRVLALGSSTARSLGVASNAWTGLLVAVAIVLAAFATAAVGPLAFVALLSGTIAARVNGTGKSDLVGSALVGAMVVTASDLLAAISAPALRLPTGLFTGLFGAGVLVTVVLRDKGRVS